MSITTPSTPRYDLTAISVRKISPSDLQIQKASAEDIAKMDEVIKNSFRRPASPADNDPSNVYATVKVGGKTVATIYNSGLVASDGRPSGTYSQIANLPSMSGTDSSLQGPNLAQKRLEEITKALGGTAEKASTAATQTAWENRPPMQWTYDYDAMSEEQRAYFKAKEAKAAENAAATSQTLFTTQSLAQSGTTSSNSTTESGIEATTGKTTASSDATTAFLDYMKKSPAERMRDMILKEKGLTEDDLKAMSPEDRAKAEAEIKDLIKKKVAEGVEKKTGIVMDL
jgi:hypothetical protein